MSGVYANAYVTIIAGNGWDADHGLRGIQGVTEPRHLSRFLKSVNREAMQPYSSIWYSRGWTFQEMIFSPRKIMFQYQIALWECNHETWHESSLSNISTPLQDLYSNPTISPWQFRIKISTWPDIEQYISLVHDYARRKLTYGDDSLNAITSLLSVMSTSFSGGFITGLPEMFFDEALLWQPAEPMQRRRSSEGKTAVASWSWAGWEGEIMVSDWKDHFSHLLRYLDPYVNDPEMIFRLIPTTWEDKRKAFLVIPVVTWFWGYTLLERFPVNVSGRTYIASITDGSLPTPPGWIISGCNYVFHDDEKNTNSTPVAYPLPILTSNVPRNIVAPYLFCRTSRGFLKSTKGPPYIITPERSSQLDIYLENTKHQPMGVLNLNLAQFNSMRPKEQTEFELVVIAAGEITGRIGVEFQEETRRVHKVILPDGYGWERSHFDFPVGIMGSHFTGSEVKVIWLYYVLWIEWENGVAYRKGLGRVLRKAWDVMDTEEIDLVLG